MVEGLVKLALLLLVLPFILAYHLCKWTFKAFRTLWTSNLDLRVKWGITGGIALLVVISAVFSSNHPGTQVASTQVQAAVTTPIDTPANTALATPSPTTAPTAKPVAVPVAPKATAPPPPPPAPAFNYCGAPANPWHYNFCGGSVIYAVPSNFCGYFPCIKSFWNQTNGYAEECADGMYSHSGGRPGACSYHQGELRAVLAS